MITTPTNINTVTKHQSLASSSTIPTPIPISTTAEVNPELSQNFPKNFQRHQEIHQSMPTLAPPLNSPPLAKEKTVKVARNRHTTLIVHTDICKDPSVIDPQVFQAVNAIADFFQIAAMYGKKPNEHIYDIETQTVMENITNGPKNSQKFFILIKYIHLKKEITQPPTSRIHKLTIPFTPTEDREFIEKLIDLGLDKKSHFFLDLLACFTNSQIADYLQMPHLPLVKEIYETIELNDLSHFVTFTAEGRNEPTAAGQQLYEQIHQLISYLDKADLKNALTNIARLIREFSMVEHTTDNNTSFMLPEFFDYDSINDLKNILSEIAKMALKDFFRKHEDGAEIDEEYKDKTLEALLTKTLLPPKPTT